MRVLLVSANREMLPSPVVPIGTLTMAAAVRDAHSVAFVDLCFEQDPLAALADAVRENGPELVGIGLRNLHTSTYVDNDALTAYYADLAGVVRETTRAPIVLGGAGFSLRPAMLLDRLGADHGVVGEGERAFRALVDALARGEAPPPLLTAAAYAERSPGGLSSPGELDRLPRPARDLIDPRYFDFDGTDNLQTKRGCAFECAYCDYPDVEGRKVRLRDPVAVAAEAAARAKTPSVTHLFIVDSVFNVPHSHAMAVCSELVRHEFALPWVCYVSPHGFDDELAAAMARAGCVGIEIGSDAGTEEGLLALRKPFTLADIRRTRAVAAAHGIRDCHSFVVGASGEDASEVARTLDFVAELDPDVAVFVVFVEDREHLTMGRARHREAILRLLTERAPAQQGWVVPELSIRFGAKLTRLVRERRLRGPSWLHLADPARRRPSRGAS